MQILLTGGESRTATTFLKAIAAAAGVPVSREYRRDHGLLVMWGAGRPERNTLRKKHFQNGGKVLNCDMGYFRSAKESGYLRVSLDHDHPWRLFDDTPTSDVRWREHGIELREDYSAHGKIVLVDMGRKSIRQLGTLAWASRRYHVLKSRFPDVPIVYRPKPVRMAHQRTTLPGVPVVQGAIEDVLRGTRLVVCRHSNVTLDATIAGVPYECEDGAGYWLRGKPFTRQNRLDLLARASWWQWRTTEAGQMLEFLKKFM